MKDFIKEHKKICILAGIAFAVLFVLYLYALFRPGYWLRDVFLYKKSEAIFGSLEVYSGHDAINSADYELTMAKDGITTYMAFTVNETERFYEIISDNSKGYYPAVTIFENEEQIFTGTYNAYLKYENGEPFEPLISFGYGPYTPTEEELFPSYNWLYNVSQSAKTEIRGEPIWLIFMIIYAGLVIFDMLHPDAFWELEHFIDTKGGEPSDFYRWAQKIGWITLPFVLIISMILSFFARII